MGNGQWAMGIGNWECVFYHYPCPMTADATTEGTSATHCLPHAPCPLRVRQSPAEGNPPAALDSPLPITYYPLPITNINA
ncbi:MAG: hypothetical protein KME31_34900 [Tolypothrix carrinoi HA7290-LM1]|nr:hypothetical protein [Tolypothrix carrinoi HA7290-LM1]